MCGVGGVWAYHPSAYSIDRDGLARVSQSMQRRGPDGQGAWYSDDGKVGLVHRRLAIIDIDRRANQPMCWNQSLVISFNGEIYNYKFLKQELKELGYFFETHSDTEVIMIAYRHWGKAVFAKLRGMFAIALWDSERRELILARDPFGIKPLYYSDDGWTFKFASQVKALLQFKDISKSKDPASQVGFYLMGSVPEPCTWYADLKAVPSGSYLVVDSAGQNAPIQFFNMAKIYHDAEQIIPRNGGRTVQDQFYEYLLDSVSAHLVADVPVGSFLSSGVDSSTITGLMGLAGVKCVRTLTLGFSEFINTPSDEIPNAENIAKHYETQHTSCIVDQREFEASSDQILHAMDQPSIDGLNAWFVSRAAHQQGLKVMLSGLGGDELIGGYPSFTNIPSWIRRTGFISWIPGGKILSRKFLHLILSKHRSYTPKLQSIFEYGSSLPGAYLLQRGLFMPWELKQVLDTDVIEEGLTKLKWETNIEQSLQPQSAHMAQNIAVLESNWYMKNQLLRDLDWAGMDHSLEVRLPLVDAQLLVKVAALGILRKNIAGKQLMVNALPNHPLKDNCQSKLGFATPISSWQEKSRHWDQWKSNASLRRDHVPWARRFAWVVANRFN